MDTMSENHLPEGDPDTIARECARFRAMSTRGELGAEVATAILRYSPADIRQMMQNFGNRIRDITPDYRERLKEKVTEHLLGTFQSARLMRQQGSFGPLRETVTRNEQQYWDMVRDQCRSGKDGEDLRLRFLKFLLAGFTMIVRREPGHAVGTPFPGGDEVQLIDGVYYCPVRDKANDVGGALCPYCPARQTPEIGYLRPPVNASEHKKQEFIDNCYRYHNFNG